MRKLSERQRSILGFIGKFLEEKGYPPTIRDIQRGCHVSSTSVVDYNLRMLERDGHIRRDREISRGIGIVDEEIPRSRVSRVPLLGSIAAGEPIPVPDNDTWESTAWETVTVPEEMVHDREGVYALRVKGTSMIDALIEDGDLVLMQPITSAQSGEMVAIWLRNERETTLKKFYLEGDRVKLQPANSQMHPIYASPANVEIQGRVIGVLRLLS